MAKQMRHSASRIPEEGVIPGCLWGLFHSFDIHQRLRLRKILGERRTSNRKRGMAIKVPKTKVNVTPAVDKGIEDDLTEASTDISSQVEERIDSADKASNKAQMRALIAQRISKQQDMPKQKGQKRKVTPFATRLLRTISIHHMECDDYVHPDEMPHDSQIQEAQLHSHNSDSSASNEYTPILSKAADEVNKDKRCTVCGTLNGSASHAGSLKLDVLGYRLLEKQALLQEKLREAKKSLIEQQKGDKGLQEFVTLNRPSDLLDALELLNANKELFLEILQEPGTNMVNCFLRQEGSRSGIALNRSSSFPGAGFSRSATVPFRKQEVKSENEILKSSASIDFTKDESQVTIDALRPVSCTYGNHETTSNSEIPASFNHVVKSQSDNVTAEHRFKTIKQRIRDIIKENRNERHRISMDGVLHKIPYGCKASQDVKGEKPTLWEGLDSDRCDGDSSRNSFGSDGSGSVCRNSFRRMRRSHSLNESLERYSYLLESGFSREPRRQISDRLKLEREDGACQVAKPPRTFGRIFSLPEFESCSVYKDDQSEVSRDQFNSSSTLMDLAQGNAAIDTNGADGQKLFDNPNCRNQYRSVLDYENTASDVLKSHSIISAREDEDVTVAYMEGNDIPAKPSPVAVSDSPLTEDPVSPSELHAFQAGSELKTNEIHLEEKDKSEVKDSNIMEIHGSDDNEVQVPGMKLDSDASHIRVDDKQQVEFCYVRDMLKTYLFDGNELCESWCSPSKQLNPLVSEEVQDPLPEIESNDSYSDIKFDHELLYDLTNEVLLEICENSYAHCPWLSRMGSHIRPVPVGYHLLEEVWANISWHLKSQPHVNPTLEYIVDRDFKRNDGWMNLNYDMEYIGLDLEASLLDDLLDEAIIDFLDSNSHQRPPSS